MSSLTVPRAREYHDADFDVTELASDGATYALRAADIMCRRGPLADAESYSAQGNTTAWDAFYRRNGGAFFKHRHFMLEAFPELRSVLLDRGSETSPSRILELGCGNGSNVFSLAAADSSGTRSRIIATDASEEALRSVAAHPDFESVAERVSLMHWDIVATGPCGAVTRGGVDAVLHDASMDAVLCTFMLSALPPAVHSIALANAVRLLRPGALFCFRDYGRLDMAQLRAPDANIITAELHRRGDGTLAYYFTVEELRALFGAVGLEVLQLRHATVKRVNRKKGVTMRRVWIHAVCCRRSTRSSSTSNGTAAM